MKLAKLELTQFTVFQHAEFHFCPGINVLIGKNSTGKSHALKAMYALLGGLAAAASSKAGEGKRDELTASKFESVFLPDQLDRLVRRPSAEPERGADILLTPEGGVDFAVTLSGNIVKVSPAPPEPPPAIFLTSRDVLAISEGFVELYDRREISFDETYADLSRALRLTRLRQTPEPLARIEKLLGGKVRLEGNRFYISLGAEEFEAHLVGEGLRKIATVAQLIANGSLMPGTILFWDEPEAGLNPQMIAHLAEFIRHLAAWGVQSFVATHDYLLSHRLSLAAGGEVEPRVPTRFFSLHRESPDEPVEIEPGDTLEAIDNNPIVRAYADYYAYQRSLFAGSTGEGA